MIVQMTHASGAEASSRHRRLLDKMIVGPLREDSLGHSRAYCMLCVTAQGQHGRLEG